MAIIVLQINFKYPYVYFAKCIFHSGNVLCAGEWILPLPFKSMCFDCMWRRHRSLGERGTAGGVRVGQHYLLKLKLTQYTQPSFSFQTEPSKFHTEWQIKQYRLPTLGFSFHVVVVVAILWHHPPSNSLFFNFNLSSNDNIKMMMMISEHTASLPSSPVPQLSV